MKLRLLKFDTINPEAYLKTKIVTNKDEIEKMGRKETLDWIISLRSNFSDFYTYYFRKHGWEAEEFFVTDIYLKKVADELYGNKLGIINSTDRIKNLIRPVKNRRKLNVISDYIKLYKPDVIFVREQTGIPSDLWKNSGKHSLIVSRLAAPLPYKWAPSDWDLILTSTMVYKKFFEINNVNSIINHNGFDFRILDELKAGEKKFDVTFIGGVGKRFWKKRTKLIEKLSEMENFKWWGYIEDEFPKDSLIIKAWQGITSGLDMLQIYKDSKIVVNDYVDMADGEGVNQRIFEVMGVGSLLLTRESETLKRNFPENVFATFGSDEDCKERIKYFLSNDAEREEIAKKGQEYIKSNYNYDNLMKDLSGLLRESYFTKFEPEAK
ncbi:MAG: glycosyltransferase family 1 protein [Ignavibacteria bacterium]|nr:glycosyltransferase family 1 protein [Ignavibacteria bacterium]